MIARLSVVFSRHGYLLAIVALALSTVLFLAGRNWFAKGQWALLYLLFILLVAGADGTWPAILASVLAFLTWNFFFLPERDHQGAGLRLSVCLRGGRR